MIYIIDEDKIQMSSLRTEFEIRGYNVQIIPNADDAWDVISSIGKNDIELLIIDIMLAAKPSLKSRFDRQKTLDYTITGICLAESLLTDFLEKCENKIIYLSHTSENGLINSIIKSSEMNKIPFFRKHLYSSDLQLAKDILDCKKLEQDK